MIEMISAKDVADVATKVLTGVYRAPFSYEGLRMVDGDGNTMYEAGTLACLAKFAESVNKKIVSLAMAIREAAREAGRNN